MSDDPKKRIKRGRPAKVPEKRAKIKSDSQSSSPVHENETKLERPKGHNKSLDQYYELHSNFTKEGISQQSQHLIRKIISNPNIPVQIKSTNLIVLLNNVTQEFVMNELEIVVMSIYLEKFAWNDHRIDIEHNLRLAAYAVKYNLSEDLPALNAYVSYKSPDFLQEFVVWQENWKHSMIVNPRELNDRFKDMSKAASLPGDTKIMDYNSYVDEILQYNPHMMYDKPLLDEIMSDPECVELIQALKSKKKIVTDNNEEVPLNLLKKVESVLGDIENIVKGEDSEQNVFVANPKIIQKIVSIAERSIEELEKDDD